MFEIDELKIYRGKDIKITDKITVTQPTIGQIEDFGERLYFQSVHNLTSVGADLKWQLWDYFGIDYTKIEDYELFYKVIFPMVSSRKYIYEELISNPDEYHDELLKLSDDDLNDMLINPLSLVLKDIDLADFKVYNDEKKQVILYDAEHDITIDRFVYMNIVSAVRQIHGFKRNNQIPANERTKMDLIDDARDEFLANSMKPYKSILKPLVSALSAKTGQCGDDRIWDMKINMFFDSIKRITRIQDAELLLQGAYSGFASLKDIDKNRLDWTGDI